MSKNVSDNFKNIIKTGGAFYAYAKVTLSNGSTFELDSKNNFMSTGNGYSEGSESGFPLGSAISKLIRITIDNALVAEELLQDTTNENIQDTTGDNISTLIQKFSADLYNARIVLYTEVDIPNGTQERVQEGIFTVVDSVYPGEVIEITAYDDMYKADQEFVSKLTYPVSAQMLLNEVCDYCDITLGSASFKNNDFQIQQPPNKLTGRQIIGYIAQIAVGNAYVDYNGRLQIKSYALSEIEEEIDPNDIETESGKHIISQYTSDPTISVEDVIITGVSTTIESEDYSKEDETYLVGSEDYAIKIDNPLISGNEKKAVDLISDVIIGMKFRPFSGTFIPNPTIEFMDECYLVDRKDNVYYSFVTLHDFDYLGNSMIANETESPQKFGGTYYSEAAQAYQKAKEDIKNNKKQWEQAIENLSQQVANSSGLYTTKEEQPDGSTIFYMHNKPTLEESDIVWKMTAETLTVSTDGGKTWNAGITVNGEVIARILSTIGINFDWGVGGTLIIQDTDGNQTAYIDADTGEIRLTVTSLSIQGKNVNEIAADEIENFISEVYDPEIENLQNQIDKKSETWYQPTDPSLQWTETEESALQDTTGADILDTNGEQIIGILEIGKTVHEGDLWKDSDTNVEYIYQDGQWIEMPIPDAVFDEIDGKARIFVTTPVPPYSERDLWMQGAIGDIMTCVNSRQSGNYVSTDWEKKNKYTDDTAVTELDQSLGQQGVFNRLTNNGKTKGLYLTEDNELYLNATYIKTGVITDNIGNNYWNLSNGEFRLSPTTTVGNQEIATKNNTISSVDVEYASGTSNTTPPETGWSTNSPEWQDDRYIWQRTVTTMADGTQNISEPTCIQGAAGVGGESTTIISNTIDYAISDSGTAPPNDWLESIPPLQPGKYLWTRTVTEYSDGESSIAYGVSYQGENGTNGTDGINGTDGTDGIGIVSSNVDYQVSDSGVTPPTGNWSDAVPDMEPGQFLWTRTQFNYTDGDVTTSYSVSYQGENGSQGVPGPPGEDGQTLYTWIKYADTPTSGMSDTPDGKKYLGIAYNKASPIESTNYSDYSWSDIKGEDGVPGTPGENGETLYTWIKYATSAAGANMSDDPTDKEYIGIAYNKTTATESTNPYDYAWSLIQGEAGIGVKGIVEQYYLSNSSTTQTGGSWSTAQPEWQKGKYIWTRSQITWTDNSITYTNPVLAKAINGANEAVDDLDTSLDQQEVFNRLTNNGKAQGIILQNGQLYINAEYIQSLILKVGGVNNENGTFEVYNGSGVLVGKIDKDGAKFTNGNDWLQISQSLLTGGYGSTTDGLLDLSANYSTGRHVVLESKTGDVVLKSADDFRVQRQSGGMGYLVQSGGTDYFGEPTVSYGETYTIIGIMYGEDDTDGSPFLDIRLANGQQARLSGGLGSDASLNTLSVSGLAEFYTPPKIYNLSHVSSGGHLVFASDGATLAYLASSSKRYKKHVSDVTSDQADKILDIPVINFKYKDGYLDKNDPLNEKSMPGFYAEDIEKIIPEATQYNDKGEPEDWNYRILIPLMVKSLQDKDKKIKELESRLNKIETALAKAGI